MKLIKKGNVKPVWRGTCKECRSEFEDTDENVRKGPVERCPREQREFAIRDCPECGTVKWVVLYPIPATPRV